RRRITDSGPPAGPRADVPAPAQTGRTDHPFLALAVRGADLPAAAADRDAGDPVARDGRRRCRGIPVADLVRELPAVGPLARGLEGGSAALATDARRPDRSGEDVPR